MKRALEADLISWKNQKEHLPILLRGARQVGKSFLIEEFGKTHFDHLAVVDFEHRPELKKAFMSRDPREITQTLELVLKKPILPGRTLLFLDEIQLCPEALISLRYFKEQLPDLHVIAAGSLLEFLLKEEEFSFPVGRVEFLYLRPFSFVEYLQAVSPIIAKRLFEYSLLNPPNELEHLELNKWVRRYLFVGGMPACVKSDLQGASLSQTQRIHHRILQAYEGDFGKYAKHTQHKYLQLVFRRSPPLVSQILKYKRLDPDARSRDLKPAVETLCHAGILQRVFSTPASGLPLHAYYTQDRYKLFFLDVGLLQTVTQVDPALFLEEDITQINAGMLAEQLVAQEFLAYSPSYQNQPLLFWENTDTGSAEIDFVRSFGTAIVPIEVKAGETGTLKSMASFINMKNPPLGIRISQRPLVFKGRILSVPFYLIPVLESLIRETRK